jgi:single-strand DNA-binding protein
MHVLDEHIGGKHQFFTSRSRPENGAIVADPESHSRRANFRADTVYDSLLLHHRHCTVIVCYSSLYMASRSVNKVILVGRLGKDAETKFTPGGASVTKFSVATSRRWKDQQSGEWKEETNWSNITFWRGENVAPYLLKGTQIYVEGRLQTRSYEDKDGKKVYATDVVADEVILLSGRGEGGGGGGGGAEEGGGYSQERPVSMPRSARGSGGGSSAPPADDFPQGITDDDVPF